MPEKITPGTGMKLEKLVEIMAQLRGPQGCPWDKEQTHESLRQYLIEEAYEVQEALDSGDKDHLREELGDLLLQVIFHAQIATEEAQFDIGEVVESISEKLIRRHPNVFGNETIRTSEEQSINWEKIKKTEGKSSTISGVPLALPALLSAHRIQQKASTVGFDWPAQGPVWDKIEEEIGEFKEACRQKEQSHIEEEFGDLLFSLVNLSRYLNVNPEDALRATTKKFARRFKEMEALFEQKGLDLADVTLSEMDEAWNNIKQTEKGRVV